jgi:hypothetical protein
MTRARGSHHGGKTSMGTVGMKRMQEKGKRNKGRY